MTECNAGRKEGNSGEGEGDGVDYSADPLTAFLGKFLPSSEEKRISPQAEDLVRDTNRRRVSPPPFLHFLVVSLACLELTYRASRL